MRARPSAREREPTTGAVEAEAAWSAKVAALQDGQCPSDWRVAPHCGQLTGPRSIATQRNGTFREVGLESGVAYDEEGSPHSGMGIDAGDLLNDGCERPNGPVAGDFDLPAELGQAFDRIAAVFAA